MKAWRHPRAVGAALILAGLPLTLPAAEPSDHFNVQEPTPPSYRPRPVEGAFQLPPVPPAAAPPAPGQTGVVLDRIVFQGNTVIASEALDAIAAPYLGRPVSDADLETLRQAVTRHYIERGYVNSGALLGSVQAGTLTMNVVEGRLTGLRIAGLERLDERYVVQRLVRDEGAVLDINALREHFVLLLEDPLFARINARLTPGERPGSAVLDLNVTRARPYQVTLYTNNYRPQSIGEQTYGISGWAHNLTGQGDIVTASVEDSLRSEASRRSSLGWRMPIAHRGTVLTLQVDHGGSSVIEEPLQALHIRSTLDRREVGISQTLVDRLAHRFTLGVDRVLRHSSTTLLGRPFSFGSGEPVDGIRIRSWRAWAEYSFRTDTRALALRYTLQSARNNIETPALPPGGTAVVPGTAYRIALGQLQYAQRLAENGTQLIVRSTIQDTPARLPSLDRMALGGVYTVRGFHENQLIRDTGSVVNLELDYPLLQDASGWRLNLVPFYDWGRGRNQNEPASILSSVGVVARARWHGFAMDLALARRMQRPDGFSSRSSSLQDNSVHLQLSWAMF